MNVDNKLIAEFLGYSQPHPDYPDTTYWYKKEQPPLTILSFDTDWNWLMQVVEKIRNFHNGTEPLNDKQIEQLSQLIKKLNESLTLRNGVSIQAVYKACVEFIKWYNEQPK